MNTKATNTKTMDLSPLLEMIRTLRGPDGCPWDQKQQLQDLRPYLIEEAHEVAAAMDKFTDPQATENPEDVAFELSGELGDLLFQVCFVAELAHQEGAFEPHQVVQQVHDKMIERHPHVYSDATLDTPEAVAQAWEQRKAAANPDRSILSGVPSSLPALTAAYRLGQKASGIGFDWQAPGQVREKIAEELKELDEAVTANCSEAIEEELGDLLLTLASFARHHDIDPERALARANQKFRRRFELVEPDLPVETVEEAERLWNKAKDRLR